nr:RHS repeat-associated core domain-containing protein [Streptomyces sp. SID13031]
MALTYDYESDTRRLARSSGGGSTIFADHKYGYDSAGNILKDEDLVRGGDTQCFDYDGHQRLTEAWTPASADCSPSPSVGALGGAAPYWQSWTYTTTGLRNTQVDHSVAGNLTSTYAYNTAQPHTLAKVTQTGAGAGPVKNLTYDSKGNTTSRPDPSTGAQTLTWSPQGKLTKLSGAVGDTEYVYDAEGSLLVRRSPTETTLFLGELELTLNKATHKVLGKRQYSFGGQPIAVRSNDGGTESVLSWLVNDYHQTTHVAVEQGTLTASIRYAKPFGEARGTPPTSWPDNHGFLGKPEDKTTGLTSIGAREYDPTIGRFISVDPLLDANDPQQMLGYTYANDNPVTGSDPTGMISECLSCGGGKAGGPDYTPPGPDKPEKETSTGNGQNPGNDGGSNNNNDDDHKGDDSNKGHGIGGVVQKARQRSQGQGRRGPPVGGGPCLDHRYCSCDRRRCCSDSRVLWSHRRDWLPHSRGGDIGSSWRRPRVWRPSRT